MVRMVTLKYKGKKNNNNNNCNKSVFLELAVTILHPGMTLLLYSIASQYQSY